MKKKRKNSNYKINFEAEMQAKKDLQEEYDELLEELNLK